jgi:exodeoxyribonuclease VII large subunit
LENSYLSVAQVNNYIKNIFEAEIMLQNICVFGEVSSYNISNGIAYFNIKDDNNLLSCVLFGALKFEAPNIGDVILVTGSVSYYAKGGKLSFNATKIAPYGKGLLYEKFLELKNKLERLGYFDPQRKKPLPARVNKIGVVTSLTGAVIQDIIDITTRRNNSVNIVIYPVKVQGVGAENEISKGIEFFSNYTGIDCIIVARGGGSIEDLQPFNTELVAQAVYHCKVPLVSAVGHETDYTIIDFVSDLRAPTPSAAAELVVNSKMQDYQFIVNCLSTIERSLKAMEKKYNYTINTNLLKMNSSIAAKINNRQSVLAHLMNNLNIGVNYFHNRYENKLSVLHSALNKQNPHSLLKQGFTKIERNGKNIHSVAELAVEDNVKLYLKDGTVHSRVIQINKGKLV